MTRMAGDHGAATRLRHVADEESRLRQEQCLRGEDNRSVSLIAPEDYSKRVALRVFASHCNSHDSY
jgi:hypothetical protein